MQCATMHRRKLTMTWDGLGEDDDDNFFESYERISSVIPLDLASSGSDKDGDFEDSRMSSVSTISSASSVRGIYPIDPLSQSSSILAGYDMWMAEPGDIRERRKRLLQGMGLSSTKDLLRLASSKTAGPGPYKPGNGRNGEVSSVKMDSSPARESKRVDPHPEPQRGLDNEPSISRSSEIMLVRSRSDGDIEAFSDRHVVDWMELHEMVTAASYTPDGQVPHMKYLKN